jgi:hypothetical protein
VSHANALNQHQRETFTTAFPKAPSRWLSPSHFISRPLALTTEGDGEGGLGWLSGATLDLSFTRSLCAPHEGVRGGPCSAPASRVVLEVRAKVAQYAEAARFGHALPPPDKGRRYRERAGRHGGIPGEDALSHFRARVGAEAIDATMAGFVELVRTFGLIQGALVSTDGPLEPSNARSKGCTYACQAGRAGRMDAASRLELCGPLPSGAKRLQRPCPGPEGVDQVRQATGKLGTPKAPQVARLEREVGEPRQASGQDRQQVATRRGLTEAEGPALRWQWGPRRQRPQGDLWGGWPTLPSEREAPVGYHSETQDPTKTERVVGYGPLKTTARNCELGLEVPRGPSTYPAHADEGSHGIAHRTTLALPVLPGPVQLGDSGADVIAHDPWRRDPGGVPVMDDNPRNEHLAPESLIKRGSEPYGTPSAPCGCLCRSPGYAYQANSRQYVCGRPCRPEEQQRCPHSYGGRGYSHGMTFRDHPRLMGPIPRGPPAWQRRYGARTAS